MTLPDYDGGSIVNLMASIAAAFGAGGGLYAPLRLLDAAPLPRDGHVVLLVVDGLGYGNVRAARGVELLRQALRGAVTSVFPSTTATAVTTFLTGVPAQQHGLTGWHMHLREAGEAVAILPFETRAGGIPLTRLGLDPDSVFTAPTFFERLDAQCFAVSPDSIARSVFNRRHTRGATIAPYRSLTQCFEAVERLCRAQHARRYVYVYLPDFDTCAHKHGVQSAAAAAWLLRFAQALERLLRSLAGRGVTLLVTADHGFVDVPATGRLELTDHPVLADCLAGPLTGERRLPYCRLRPGSASRFVAYVGDALAHVCDAVPTPELIARRHFGLGAPHPQLAGRAGDYALIMKPGYTLKDWLPDERPHTLIGVHGGVTDDEMRVPLMVFTP